MHNLHTSLFDKSKSMFIVWGPPSYGPRSRVFARELGIDAYFIYLTLKKGFFSGIYKYPYQAIKTLALLFTKRPKLVIVQSPPSFAVFFVYLYCLLTGSEYIVDAHSAAFSRLWLYPLWLTKHLARKAVTTFVTNEHFQHMIQNWGAHSFILHDIPTTFSRAEENYPLDGEFNVVVINTFSPDEPLEQVLSAAAKVPDVHFYVTGRKGGADLELLTEITSNIHFTDFLPNDTYYALLGSVQAVMCLTTRDHTMQRGACEALWMGKPIITSDWNLLREYFQDGTIHVNNSSDAIVEALNEMRKNRSQYENGILDLQSKRRLEWQEKIEALTDLMKK